MIDTRSGELLSGCIGLVMAVVLLINPDSIMAVLLEKADAQPEWALMALCCSLLSIAAVFIKSAKVQTLSRFISGCMWGTLALLYGYLGQPYVVFWISVLLFSFDIIVVITKGQHTWIPKSRF